MAVQTACVTRMSPDDPRCSCAVRALPAGPKPHGDHLEVIWVKGCARLRYRLLPTGAATTIAPASIVWSSYLQAMSVRQRKA